MDKIQNTNGETLAETLVALLVSTLAIVMLAGAIGTAFRIITTSNQKMDEYYEKDVVLAEQKESAASTGISINEEIETVGTVNYYINDTFQNKEVVAYKLQ